MPPGTHDVTVSFYGNGGGVVNTVTIPKVEVKAGKKVFLSLRTF